LPALSEQKSEEVSSSSAEQQSACESTAHLATEAARDHMMATP
jgi:hypothetical protein